MKVELYDSGYQAVAKLTIGPLPPPGAGWIAQYYANLELPYGASLDDVRRNYREMMRKYHPDKHAGNPERHKAATELATSLTNAYRILVDHLSKR